MSKLINIAVYGTLRQGFWNYERFLEGRSEFVLDCQLPGFSMYGGKIPHIVENPSDTNGIYVEIHWVPVELLPYLDALEGYSEGSNDNIYTRLTVKTPVGSAYIYALGEHTKSVYGTTKDKVPFGIYNGHKRDAILKRLNKGESVY